MHGVLITTDNLWGVHSAAGLTIEVQVREMTRKLQGEMRGFDRQIRGASNQVFTLILSEAHSPPLPSPYKPRD